MTMGTTVTIAAFSYLDVPVNYRQDVRDRTEAIRERFRRQTMDIIATGRDLIEIKSKLDHGQWLAWLEIEFPANTRTAQRFMAAAEWAEGKSDTVSYLPPAVLYLLSAPSSPPEIVTKVVDDLDAGKPVNATTIKEMISGIRRSTPAPAPLATVAAPPPLGKRAEKEIQERRDIIMRATNVLTTITDLAKKIEVPPVDADLASEILADLDDGIRALRRLRREVFRMQQPLDGEAV